MGRKSAKGKEKRLQRKAEQARIEASQKLVNEAKKQKDPLENLVSFQKYNKNGLEIKLECSKVTDMSEADVRWVFDLCKKNMQTLYEQSSNGWNDRVKWEEMTEEEAWYLLARNTDGKLVAFSHFRFDMDYGDEVLYCYELQLVPEVRRKGLGRHMMQILELMAFRANMLKVVLTVFNHNPSGVDFFTRMKYEMDETSPEDNLVEEFDYKIFSKFNKRKQAAQSQG